MQTETRRRRKMPEGHKWIQAVLVPEEVHRRFAVRCAEQGLDRLQVLRKLVELYAGGIILIQADEVQGKG